MTTAFVAGATGYTGREVVRELLRRGIRTIAHVRPGSRQREEIERECGELGGEVDCSPWDQSAIRATLARLRPDVVFALLGTTRARARAAEREGEGDASYEAVDYGLTALLIRAVRDAGLGSKVVYLSALGTDGAGATSGYYAARQKVEAELRAIGLPYVIARPSFITGPDRGEVRLGERVAAVAADGLLSLVGAVGGRSGRSARELYSSMTARDLARGLVALALDPSTTATIADTRELRRRSRDPV